MDEGPGQGTQTPYSTNIPWFWGWDGKVDFTGGPEFTGERFNDCHYTLDFKRQARQRADDKEGAFS